MPFATPTFEQLRDRIRDDLRVRLAAWPVAGRAAANLLAPVWAGATLMLHGHAQWIFRQGFADTADPDQVLRESAQYGIAPTSAAFAKGPVFVVAAAGSVVPAGEILKSASGVEYAALSADPNKDGVGWTLSGGTDTLLVEAVLAGAAGNLAAGEPLTFDSPVPGVQSDATVAAPGIRDGRDEGTIESTRARLIQRKRFPPQGGAVHDYEAWALEVPGVTRAWVFRWEGGLGRVVVRFTVEGADPIPDVDKVAEVQAALEAQAPIVAEVEAIAPIPLPVNCTLRISPDTPALRESVTSELRKLIARDGAPGDGAGQGTIFISRILGAIAGSGVDDFALGFPVAHVVPPLGQLPVLGTLTFDPWV